MNKEPHTMQVADAVTASRAPENTPAMVKKIGKTTYKVHVLKQATLDLRLRAILAKEKAIRNDDSSSAASLKTIKDESKE